VLKVFIKYFLGAFKSRKAPLIPIMSISKITARMKTIGFRIKIVKELHKYEFLSSPCFFLSGVTVKIHAWVRMRMPQLLWKDY